MQHVLKLSRLWTTAALLQAVLLGMTTTTAPAQETVRIAVPDSASVSTTADRIIVTKPSSESRDFSGITCMTNNGFDGTHPVQWVVVIDTSTRPKATLIDVAYLEPQLSAGMRLIILDVVYNNCSVDGTDYDIFEAEMLSPQNLGVALVSPSPGETLTADHEAVVGGGTDEYGYSSAICVAKGEKPVHTELWSDIDLLSGDRLADFVEVDYDADTGETTYTAWVEY